MRFRIFFFIIVLLVAGCVTVETCDENNDSELVGRFKTIVDELTADSSVNYLSVLGIREGLADSLLYDSVPGSSFLLPLNPHASYSGFVVTIDDLSDTLWIYHHHESYMISYTCGFGNLFTIDSMAHTYNNFKSDTIVSTLVDADYEDDEEHIWLYL